MVELANINNQPVVQVRGVLGVTCQNIVAPNGLVVQTAVNVSSDQFDMNTAEGQLEAAQWLADAAKSLFTLAFNTRAQGGEQSKILRLQPGTKVQ
jgi:hypothetical protein